MARSNDEFEIEIILLRLKFKALKVTVFNA